MESPTTKFTTFMCLLRESVSIRFRSFLQLYWMYRQREKSRGLQQHNGAAALEQDPAGRHIRIPPDPRHAAVSRMSHPGTRGAFPNSTRASGIASLPSCTASLISSVLPCPITSQLDLASSPWLGQFPFWLVPWGGISCDSAGTMQQGKAHRAQRDRQRRRHLWHLLCVGSYITLWYSGVEAAWRHNGSAGSSWMLQNKKHVEKSAVQSYSFVSDKKTGQPRKLVKYCSPMS